MKADAPEDSLEAIRIGQWRQWLEDPITKLFFAQLRHDQILELRSAACASIQTQAGNAKEHNKLVRGAEIERIINTYANGTSKYPFTLTISAAGLVSPTGI